MLTFLRKKSLTFYSTKIYYKAFITSAASEHWTVYSKINETSKSTKIQAVSRRPSASDVLEILEAAATLWVFHIIQ